jgi:uncharacterized protein (DUF1330 family)
VPAFVLIDIDVTDPARYEAYKRLSGPAAEKHGGRFVVRGGAVTPLEGAWSPTRLVVLEFPSVAAARTWYDSPEYAEARRARAGAADFRAVIVEGVTPPSGAGSAPGSPR